MGNLKLLGDLHVINGTVLCGVIAELVERLLIEARLVAISRCSSNSQVPTPNPVFAPQTARRSVASTGEMTLFRDLRFE